MAGATTATGIGAAVVAGAGNPGDAMAAGMDTASAVGNGAVTGELAGAGSCGSPGATAGAPSGAATEAGATTAAGAPAGAGATAVRLVTCESPDVMTPIIKTSAPDTVLIFIVSRTPYRFRSLRRCVVNQHWHLESEPCELVLGSIQHAAIRDSIQSPIADVVEVPSSARGTNQMIRTFGSSV